MTPKRIKLRHLPQEWELLEDKLKSLGKKNLNSYLRSEISKLEIKFQECPTCFKVERSTEKVHYISPDTYQKLETMCEKSNAPMATLIDQLIIMPLLFEK